MYTPGNPGKHIGQYTYVCHKKQKKKQKQIMNAETGKFNENVDRILLEFKLRILHHLQKYANLIPTSLILFIRINTAK